MSILLTRQDQCLVHDLCFAYLPITFVFEKQKFYMERISFIFLIGLITSFGLQAQTQHDYPKALTAVFDAHGGLDNWKTLQTLKFTKGDGEGAEVHTTHLWDRRALIEGPGYTIGNDGQQVWLSPSNAEFKGNARFYHNLYFYFYAMPFVLADPGIRYDILPDQALKGKTYGSIKVSYDDGIGDSPKDNYILFFDKSTHQMEWLMYTVTYNSGEASDNYSLIKYSDWQKVGGVVLPGTLTWYVYENGEVGEAQGGSAFTAVSVSTATPANGLFSRPADAKVVE